ncbi:uncharacterized protein LOC127290933 [Leptopilina boulardi]|uniref:uncharacterized protein LOC127290933 n=1 Tax=Leptopilina boulardi TaxID=63433 RepID=UPI0021F5EBDB|nr:uncharacterized protein LOC127290933 [Leptopilina boulardi]
MEVANLTSTLHTIQMISIATYMQRLSNFLHLSYNLNVNDKNNSMAIINSFVIYLNTYEKNDIDTNFLTYWLLNDNVYYDKANDINIKYNSMFKKMLFDHIIHHVVFNDYGNVYGFLAEHVRNSESLPTLHNLFENVVLSLNFLRIRSQNSLSDKVIRKIFNKIIVPLSLELKNNLYINSLDFIYAQAGCRFSYLINRENSIPNSWLTDNERRNIFQTYLEIGLAVKQMASYKIIDKLSLKIFALPALLNYVYINKEKLRDIEMTTIVSDKNHWTNAYDNLFSYLHNSNDLIIKTKAEDPKYQYYLAVLHFKNYTTLVKEELTKKCIFAHGTQLENEINKYINNTANYTCLGSQNLLPLEQFFKEQVNDMLHKYYQFKIKEEEEKNETITIDRYEINNKIFVNCKNLSEDENILETEHKYCLSLLYSCIVDLIEGNPINLLTNDNCPISGGIHINEVTKFYDLIQHLTTIKTRNEFSKLGTTIRTIALMSSILRILRDEKTFWRLKNINIKNNTFVELGIPNAAGINHGFEIHSIYSPNDVFLIEYLIKKIGIRSSILFEFLFKS